MGLELTAIGFLRRFAAVLRFAAGLAIFLTPLCEILRRFGAALRLIGLINSIFSLTCQLHYSIWLYIINAISFKPIAPAHKIELFSIMRASKKRAGFTGKFVPERLLFNAPPLVI